MAEAITKELAGVEVFDIAENPELSFDQLLISRYLEDGRGLNDAPVKVLGDRVIGQGGVLSDQELRVGLELGHVICDPYPTRINTTSIDVRLGENFYLAGHARNVSAIFNPFDQEDVDRYFGEPLVAEPFKKVMDKAYKDVMANDTLTAEQKVAVLEKLHGHENLNGIDDEHPLILLRPRERILAHTLEFIGIRRPGTTSMQSRSTTGRIGVASCFCAGWGDSGYTNRWTMEVNNLNETEYVPLPIYYRIAQIAFYSAGPSADDYGNITGKYQTASADDMDAVKAAWQPSAMLPRSPKDADELAAFRQQQLGLLEA